MRIAIIRKKYTFHGGAEGFSSSFIANLANEGHEIHIFAIKWQTEAPHKNIHFHKVPALTFMSFLRDLTFAVSSFLILKKQRKFFDIIQSHDKTLYQDIYRAGDGCHIEWLRQRKKRLGPAGKLSININPYHWLVLALERAIFKGHKYKKIIAISEMVKRNIIDNYKVAPMDIEVIYNGVDLERFCPDNQKEYRRAIRDAYGLTDKDFVILFVGSGFERKGLKYLIEAIESIAGQVSLMVAGKGSRSKYEKLAVRQNLIFCGPQKDIYKYYAAADLFVFPTMYEPFGNVHLEALASGLPVITTANSGAAEIITDGEHGFVIRDPEDISDISRKIGICMSNSDKLRAMGEKARELAEKFTFERHIGKTVELYESIIDEKRIK